jgi:hypothetical protein
MRNEIGELSWSSESEHEFPARQGGSPSNSSWAPDCYL